jgi:hypothetical protein
VHLICYNPRSGLQERNIKKREGSYLPFPTHIAWPSSLLCITILFRCPAFSLACA